MTCSEAAERYLAAGLCVLPARRAEKRPAVGEWKRYRQSRPTDAELSAWLANPRNTPDAICIVTGAVSGNAEIIDFDAGGELFAAWWERLPVELRERLVIETTPSGGYHVIYRCEAPVCGNLKLAQRKVGDRITTLIETRGEGGLFLCAPTMGYILAHGDLADLPVLTVGERDALLHAAWELNEYVLPVVNGPTPSANVGHHAAPSAESGRKLADNSHRGDCPTDNGIVGQRMAMSVEPCGCASHNADRPGDDFNHRGDPRDVLAQHGWVRVKGGENEYWRRPGKESGMSATLKDGVFYVFSSNAAPFEPNRGYSPFAVYALLNHGGDFEQAASSLRLSGYGSDSLPHTDDGLDISGMVGQIGGCATDHSHNGHGATDNLHIGGGETDTTDNGDGRPEITDPGPMPERVFDMPGFVRQVMDFTLANAPYPNTALAFCGAMSLQSFLAGRKVATAGDLRPNLYLLALASSGTGKDFPRKVNARVLFEIGQTQALGDKFASGEGIQDALARTPAMLFQNDEMDGVLRQINLDKENKRESIPNILLTLYTSASDIYPLRVKAAQKEAGHIDQPHLTLFGTATPQYFYESLSQRMLTNGFFARMIIIDVGKRGVGQTPGSARNLPEPILQTARWWNEYRPGTRHANLLDMHPDPRTVPFTPEAAEAVDELRRMAEQEYIRADEANDEVARTAWSRTCENATRLALIHACSANHEDPRIDLVAVEWATAFAMHQTRRQLYLATTYVAENPFHAECLKVVRNLKAAPDRQMARRELMRAMRCKLADFDQIVATLMQQGEIVPVEITTRTKPAQGYRLT